MTEVAPLRRPRVGALDCADEERVVAGLVLGSGSADKPTDRAFELRRPLGLA